MNSFEITKEILIAMLQNKTTAISEHYANEVANAFEIIYNKVEELQKNN